MATIQTNTTTDLNGWELVNAAQTALRSTAKRVTQTINTLGQVVAILYTFKSGGTITDIYTYGPNSLTEPISVEYGDLVLPILTPPAPTLVNPPTLLTALSNFTISSDGIKLNYSASIPVTALSGMLTVGGLSRTLTHLSSGVATISGTAILSSVTGITLSIVSSTPLFEAAINNAPVVNNSTVNPPASLVLTPISWSTGNGGSQTGDVLSIDGTNRGALASPIVNAALPFEIVVSDYAQSFMVYLGNDNTLDFTYGTAALAGIVVTQGALYKAVNSTSNLITLGAETPGAIKLAKSGNDIVISKFVDTDYVVKNTLTGILTGKTNIYLKALSAYFGGSANIKLYT